MSSEKDEYAAAVKAVAAAAGAAQEGDVDLSMRMIIKDGDALIADSENGGFVPACKVFADYVTKRFFNQEGAAEEKMEG